MKSVELYNSTLASRLEGRHIVFLLLLALLSSPVAARYMDVALSPGSELACGILEDGRVECVTQHYREPSVINGDPNQRYVEIGVGSYFTCGITDEGSVNCWGDNVSGIHDVPTFDAAIAKLSVAGYYACAVDSASKLNCWGQNDHGQATPPADSGGFIDVSSSFYFSCGLKTDSSIVCWGRHPFSDTRPVSEATVVPASAGELAEIEFGWALHCGLRVDGSALCWNPEGQVLAEFNNGPYRKLLSTGFSSTAFACAVTETGELDCTNGAVPTEGEPATPLSVQRLPGSYVSVDSGLNSRVCGYTLEDRLECPKASHQISNSALKLLATFNRELDMPAVVITDGVYYGFATELFYGALELDEYNLSVFYDMEIFRDGEYLATTENARSYVDNSIEPERQYSYSVRPVHLFGQTGDFSNAVTISTSADDEPLSENPQPQRPHEPLDLRAEVYWYDVELFWARDTSGVVRNYEIRRNGELVATTRGTSWYDNSTTEGELYVYDVIAVGHDDAILGFRSVHVRIGEHQCS